jgi:uncharacterized protein (PEP-CTERM system associated)
VSSTPGQRGDTNGALYDLLFLQFSTVQPDPVAREQMVNAYLQTNGLSGNTVVNSGFLSSALSLQRRQDLSFALLGLRDTLTLIATRSQTRTLDALSQATGDLSASPQLRQHGLSANYSHRLTPDYTLGVLASEQVSTGLSGTLEQRLRSLNFNLSGKVGKKSAMTLGLRRVVASGATPYQESALSGNLNVPF